MCQRIQCDVCGKPTYAGCGRHIEQVLGDVPEKDRCQCQCRSDSEPRQRQNDSFWKRLFG